MKVFGNRQHTGRPNDPLPVQFVFIALVVGLLGAGFLFATSSSGSAEVPVPRAAIPAYQVIREADLISTTVSLAHMPEKSLRTTSELVGRYTLAPLPAKTPVVMEQVHALTTPTLISDTIAMSIQATPAMVWSGNLQAGDTVDVLVTPAQAPSQTPASSALFQNILVLDVQAAVASSSTPVTTATAQTYVVMLAIPRKDREAFALQVANGTVIFTRPTLP